MEQKLCHAGVRCENCRDFKNGKCSIGLINEIPEYRPKQEPERITSSGIAISMSISWDVINSLNDDEFDQVWTAFGVMFRVKGRKMGDRYRQMKKPQCKSNPNIKCVATKSCYEKNYLKNHSCGGCCKELWEREKIWHQ